MLDIEAVGYAESLAKGDFNNEFLPGNAPHVLRIAAGVPKLDSCPKAANLLVIWGFAEQRVFVRSQCQRASAS
jgi:hypothetical protein